MSADGTHGTEQILLTVPYGQAQAHFNDASDDLMHAFILQRANRSAWYSIKDSFDLIRTHPEMTVHKALEDLMDAIKNGLGRDICTGHPLYSLLLHPETPTPTHESSIKDWEKWIRSVPQHSAPDERTLTQKWHDTCLVHAISTRRGITNLTCAQASDQAVAYAIVDAAHRTISQHPTSPAQIIRFLTEDPDYSALRNLSLLLENASTRTIADENSPLYRIAEALKEHPDQRVHITSFVARLSILAAIPAPPAFTNTEAKEILQRATPQIPRLLPE